MSVVAFQPAFNAATTLVIASSSTASTPTQCSTASAQGFYVVNASTAGLNVWIAFGASSAVRASLPSTGTPATGMFLPPNVPQHFSTPPGAWLSALTTAGTANVFASPGYFGG
jgi:hypothetical protein